MKFFLTVLLCTTLAIAGAHPDCLADEEPLLVFAASSLAGPLDSLASRYMALTSTPILIAYGASGSLAEQIRIGADVDLFFSADTGSVVRLVGDRNSPVLRWQPFLRNRLVTVTSAALDHRTRAFGALDGAAVSKIAIADPETDPAGACARSYLQRTGVYDRVQGKLAIQDDVRGVINAVRLGVVDLGFVYASDVITSGKGRLVDVIADSLYPPIVFGLATMRGGHDKASGQFVEFLHSPGSLDLFSRAGFIVDSMMTRH